MESGAKWYLLVIGADFTKNFTLARLSSMDAIGSSTNVAVSFPDGVFENWDFTNIGIDKKSEKNKRSILCIYLFSFMQK